MIHIKPCRDYNQLSELASDDLATLIQHKPDAVICLATGNSPLQTYQYLVQKVRQRHIDVSQMTLVKLDEWIGMPLDSPETCETYLQRYLVQPLGLKKEQLISFRSEKIDEFECMRITNLIELKGGLDLCLLGLGKNGHLGLNEPGEELEPCCHIAKLAEKTGQHDMLKTSRHLVEFGITLGIKEILSAKKVILLVTGDGKQEAVDKLLTTKVSTLVPATFLWLHNHVQCLLDNSLYRAV